MLNWYFFHDLDFTSGFHGCLIKEACNLVDASVQLLAEHPDWSTRKFNVAYGPVGTARISTVQNFAMNVEPKKIIENSQNKSI